MHVPSESPMVLYVAGSGRSGSTLLERMLGGMPGVVNVGELIDLFRRVHAGDERCGCGEPFSACPLWQQVGRGLWSGGWSEERVAAVHQLQRAVARQRFVPLHLAGRLAPDRFREHTEHYRVIYTELYRSVAAATGARTIVDASKWPAQALALAHDRLDLRVIHIVRDLRGVVHSMAQSDLTRPHATRGEDLMFSQGQLSTTLRWTACQLEAELLRARAPVTRVHYEDLVQDARGTVLRALEEVGVPVGQDELDHLGQSSARLPSSHGLSGNPSRFTTGEVDLRLDERWRHHLPRGEQLLLGALAAAWGRHSDDPYARSNL